MLRDALGDAYHQVQLSFNGLHDGGSSKGGGDIDHTGVALRLGLGLLNALEDGQTEMLCAALLGVHTTHLQIGVANSDKCGETSAELFLAEKVQMTPGTD